MLKDDILRIEPVLNIILQCSEKGLVTRLWILVMSAVVDLVPIVYISPLTSCSFNTQFAAG